MKLLANENFPREAVEALRTQGHDVVWVRESAPGSKDQEVLKQASSEERVLLTFDKDFGELAFRIGLPVTSGVILFRVAPLSPSWVAQVVVKLFVDRSDWAGHFSVIDATQIRMTRLPPQSAETPSSKQANED